MEKVLGNDDRQIQGIYGPGDSWSVEIGNYMNVEKIECYIEDSNVPWFAVYINGTISQRINSTFVETVTYSDGDIKKCSDQNSLI